MVDPRRVGFAAKADQWLRVRPGSDGAPALGIAGVMLDEGWFDCAFVRDWTIGPLLVRQDTGHFLNGVDLSSAGDSANRMAWDRARGTPVLYDSATGSCERAGADLAPLRKIGWAVYAKRPFAGPEAVLAYLARYTHRVAISNSRLIAFDGKTVTFRWKNYRATGTARYKTMTLPAHEFIRCFLIHVLPAGFHCIRHYGLFANGNRAANIARARELLRVPAAPRHISGRSSAVKRARRAAPSPPRAPARRPQS